MTSRGRKIVLAASTSESSEYLHSTWKQMLLACLPARYPSIFDARWAAYGEVWPDGQAKYVPQGLRVVEALPAQRFPQEDIAVCYPDQLDQFLGEDTRVVGVHAHNPLGITFATDVYAHLYGAHLEPVNAEQFRRLILHPLLRQHKPHLKLIVGGPGAWQIEKKNLQDEWLIDCIFDGESEEGVVALFESAVRGETLPRRVEGHSPRIESIPLLRHRSTFGAVEITRGRGRGCQFCSVALRAGKSFPLDQIIANVRTQAAEGADFALLVTEDLFLYEHGPRFAPNVPALKRLFQSVAAVDGIQYIGLTHGTMAPIVAEPNMLSELHVAVDRSVHTHVTSTHPEKRYQNLFIGIETGSPRLFKELMKGKGYPFRPEQWPDVVLKGMEILNRNNWFPFCTWIIGLPGETTEDTRQSLDLLHALKDAKWCVGAHILCAAGGHPAPEARKRKNLQAYRSAMEVFLHVLTVQLGLLQSHNSLTTSLRNRRADLLLLGGPTPFRTSREVSSDAFSTFSGEDTEAQSLFGPQRKAGAAISRARSCAHTRVRGAANPPCDLTKNRLEQGVRRHLSISKTASWDEQFDLERT